MPDDKAKTVPSDDLNIAGEAERLALKTGITADQARELIARTGSDPVALEEAVRDLRAREAGEKTETEDEKALRLAETTDISPQQAKDLMREHGKDSEKVDEEAENFKAEG